MCDEYPRYLVGVFRDIRCSTRGKCAGAIIALGRDGGGFGHSTLDDDHAVHTLGGQDLVTT